MSDSFSYDTDYSTSDTNLSAEVETNTPLENADSHEAYVLELENRVEEQYEEIKRITKYYNEKEIEFQAKLKSMGNMLSLEREQTVKLIFETEHDKKYYNLELERLRNKCTSCNVYKDEVSKLLDSMKSLEAASKVLQTENELLTDQIQRKAVVKLTCFHCVPSSSETEPDNYVDPLNEAENKKVAKRKNTNKRKMLLCTDGLGIDLAWHINKVSKTLDAYSFIKIGGHAYDVLSLNNLKEGTLVENSIIVIACGSNDVYCNKANSAIDIISNTVKSMSKTQVIVVDLPLTYDLPVWSYVNMEIRRTNHELLCLSKNVPNVTLVKASQAHRSFYIGHGLHLNHRGKQWLAGKICEAAENRKQLLPFRLETPSENSGETGTTIYHSCCF